MLLFSMELKTFCVPTTPPLYVSSATFPAPCTVHSEHTIDDRYTNTARRGERTVQSRGAGRRVGCATHERLVAAAIAEYGRDMEDRCHALECCVVAAFHKEVAAFADFDGRPEAAQVPDRTLAAPRGPVAEACPHCVPARGSSSR